MSIIHCGSGTMSLNLLNLTSGLKSSFNLGNLTLHLLILEGTPNVANNILIPNATFLLLVFKVM